MGRDTKTFDIPDFVTSPEPDPLRDRSVLLGLLGQDPLDLKGFLRRLQQKQEKFRTGQAATVGVLNVRRCIAVQQCTSWPESGALPQSGEPQRIIRMTSMQGLKVTGCECCLAHHDAFSW